MTGVLSSSSATVNDHSVGTRHTRSTEVKVEEYPLVKKRTCDGRKGIISLDSIRY